MKQLLPILLLLALALTAVWLLLRNPSGEGMHAAQPDITIDARTLFADFEADRAAANEKYLNKTVVVTGEVTGISADASGMPVLTLSGKSNTRGVRCSFDPLAKHERKEYHRGEVLQLKCVCVDYYEDVVLRNCVEK